jgi:hypothetical protein
LRLSQIARTMNEGSVSGIEIMKKAQIDVFCEEIYIKFIPSREDTKESGMKEVAKLTRDLFQY